MSKKHSDAIKKVVLFQPQIPQNTGNIVRTCANTGTDLILVRPLGFQTSDRMLKRAGLDYWENVTVTVIDDLLSFLEKQRNCKFYFFSSKATTPYSTIDFSDDDLFIFGSETAGLPDLFWNKWPNHFFTIPKKTEARCLNLASAVAIVLYEAWRQQNFA